MTQKDIIDDNLILQTKGLFPEPLKTLKEAKGDFEKKYLISLLDLTKGNVSKASDLAGKYRADFYILLKKYDLKPEDFKKA